MARIPHGVFGMIASLSNDAELRLMSRSLNLAIKNPVEISQKLSSSGGLRALLHSGAHVLEDVLPPAALEQLDHIFALASYLMQPVKLPEQINDASDVATFFRPRLALSPNESMWALFLDVRGQPLGFEQVALGTLTACLVHPREVLGPAIRIRAAQIVLVHNHPSGDPSPSDDDYRLTERMMEAGQLLGIPVVDHVVIGKAGFASVSPGF